VSGSEKYFVVLFRSVSHAMKAEKLLKESEVPHKLIPVPKNISSDCGICIRFGEGDVENIRKFLEGEVEYTGITLLV
jgi:hypothetical protein